MDKRLLLKNILLDLNQLPVAYIRQWYEKIHAFREKVSNDESAPTSSGDADFDWDALLEDVLKQRKEENLRRSHFTESLSDD